MMILLSFIKGLLLDGQKSSGKFFKFFTVNKFAKTAVKSFVAMPNTKLPHFWGQDKPSSYISVIDVNIERVGPGREFFRQIH